MQLNDRSPSVLHIIHGSFQGPFIEAARSYNALLKATLPNHRIVTVFLKGSYNEEVELYIDSDEVLFLDASRHQLKGSQKDLGRRLRQIYSKNAFDLCIAHRTKSTNFALRYFNCPVFSVHHAYGDYSKFMKRLFLRLYKSRVTLIGVSQSVTDELRKRFPQWSINHFETIHNRININQFKRTLVSREEARDALGISIKDWVVGHVGRLHPIKDQASLIRGFAKASMSLPANAKLVIAGNGDEEQRLKELATKMEISDKVIFTGYLKQAKQYFKAFDCFVLSSIHETFGMVLLEAMVADVPCIVSDCGGAIEVIGECGYIFRPGDVNTLSKLLIQLHNKGPACSADLTRKRLIDNFSDEAAIKKFEHVLLSHGLKN